MVVASCWLNFARPSIYQGPFPFGVSALVLFGRQGEVGHVYGCTTVCNRVACYARPTPRTCIACSVDTANTPPPPFGLQACQSDLSQGGQDEHPRLPPPAVLYWAVAKVPPDTMQQLLRVLGREPQEACPASPGGHRRQQQQQQQKEEAAVPEPLSPAHLEMVAQAVVQHPMGVIAAVTEAMMREVGQQAKDTCALALKQLEQTVLAFVVAACCLATWRTQGGPAPAPAPAPAGPPTPPRSPQAPHQQHAKQQPQQQRLLRQRTGGGSSGAGAADQDDALFDCVRSTPWAGPETLRRLQLAVRAMAEYGWLEEPYGCTAADQQGLQPEQLEAIAHRSMTGVVGSTTGAELVLLSARIRADSALGSAGMQQALTVTEEGRLPELAAFREARSAALCVRGAPLSGCQLRGVVEALRPGLLAAHPGTWGAAVRRAEEREQRGEQEEDRLMVRIRLTGNTDTLATDMCNATSSSACLLRLWWAPHCWHGLTAWRDALLSHGSIGVQL